MNFGEAKKLLKEYVKKEEIRLHCLEVSTIMRYLAPEFKEDEEKWAIAGLLHDLDYELFSNLDEHAKKTAQILREKDISEDIIQAILSHNEEYTHVKRENLFEYCLSASDNISGMIFAYGLMRKSLNGMEVNNLKKKMKEKSFAATVRRDLIYDIEKFMSLNKFLEISIKAMQSIAKDIGFNE